MKTRNSERSESKRTLSPQEMERQLAQFPVDVLEDALAILRQRESKSKS